VVNRAAALHFIGDKRPATEYGRRMTDLPPPQLAGYARVSSADQSDGGQVDALRRAGAGRVVTERASGVADRPLLDALTRSLRPGDTLAVTEVSRLGRTTAEVLQLADALDARGVHLRVLNLGIDTATPAGGLVLAMMAGLARFERELLRERQRRGIDAARARGKHLGRPAALTADHARRAAARLRAGETLAELAAEWRVSERTLSRLLRRFPDGGPPPTAPGGRGKPKRRGQLINSRENAWTDC
jgi:DNA invertase Pin-like site-specific DNA recombinase